MVSRVQVGLFFSNLYKVQSANPLILALSEQGVGLLQSFSGLRFLKTIHELLCLGFIPVYLP